MLLALLFDLVKSSDLDFSENSLFSGNDFPLDQTSSVDGLAPLSQDDSTLFEDLNNGVSSSSGWNDLAMDGSISSIDCASFENFPSIGKARAKRLDNSDRCKNTDTKSPTSDDSGLPDLANVLRSGSSSRGLMLNPPTEDDKNNLCGVYTSNLLPWGICSSGRAGLEVSLNQPLDISPRGVYTAWSVYYFTIGTLTKVSWTANLPGCSYC